MLDFYSSWIYTGSMGKVRTTNILVRLQPAEKQAFHDAASEAGIGLSAWVRERLRRQARRELEEAGRKIAFLIEPVLVD